MELVNGYPCFDCTDVDLAKKGINPAKPESDPRSLDYNPNAPGAKPSGFDNSAVTFGGSLSALNASQAPDGSQSSSGGGSSFGSSDAQQSQARQSQPGTTLDISV